MGRPEAANGFAAIDRVSIDVHQGVTPNQQSPLERVLAKNAHLVQVDRLQSDMVASGLGLICSQKRHPKQR